MSKVVFLITSASFSRAREAVDLILGISAFVDDITVVFKNDGLRLLFAKDLKPILHGERDFLKTMGMFELYEINDLLYVSDSNVVIDEDNPLLPVKEIDSCKLHELLEGAVHRIVL